VINTNLCTTKVKVGPLSVSCFLQRSGSEAIVFIHGFGASKRTFLEAFHFGALQSLTMVALDLIGFGDSEKPPDFSYLMRDQAKIIRKVIDVLGLGRFNLVAHSMGGIIGIELAEMIPVRVRSFVNAEGNITIEDCSMSGRVAGMSAKSFAQEGLEQIKHSLAEESEKSRDQILKEYLDDFSMATPESLYKSALSTVQESVSGDLLKRFAQLPMYKCNVYGEKNRGAFLAEEKLRECGVPLFYVSKSGHSMMKENTSEFYNLVLNAIHCGSRECPKEDTLS
jgi:pimeloyl-ACP methyl ester carboxylesterase